MVPRNLHREISVNILQILYFSIEVHRFLSYECMKYIPSLETVTDIHLRDIMSGAKTSLETYQIKAIAVPHYKGLTIKDILEYAGEHQVVMNALPVPKECLRLERQYLGNLVYSIVGEPFKKWVDDRVNHRNEKVAIEGN